MPVLYFALVFTVGLTVYLVGSFALRPFRARYRGVGSLILVWAVALVLYILPALALGIHPGESRDIFAAWVYLTGGVSGAILHAAITRRRT